MRLPENVTVYIGGKKFTRNIPDNLAPEGLKDLGRTETKPLKRVVRTEKKDSE